MSSSELERIEASIAASKETVALGKSLDRLFHNADFKRVILEQYLEKEAIRLVHLRAAPDMQTPVNQQNILLQLDAIGQLGQFFQTVRFLSAQAEKAIEIDELTRDEIIEEGLQ